MSFIGLASAVSDEVRTCLLKTDENEINAALDLLDRSGRIFAAGAGRSRLAAAAFAMRLMHIGYKGYLVGEVATPAITEGDLLVLCSGSGETKSMIPLAETAKKCGAKVLLFTTKESSSLASMSDCKVLIHAKAAKSKDNENSVSVQPMSNLFVQTLGLILDIMITELMDRHDIDESLMKQYHANLE